MDILASRESGEKHRFQVPGLSYEIEIPYVLLPRENGDRLKIASLNLVGQTRLNRDLGVLLAGLVRQHIADLEGVAMLCVVEKALQLAQVTAMELGMDETAIAYNRIKPHMEPGRRPIIQIGVDSITSGDKFLALYERDINILHAAPRGIFIVDDVISSGGTMFGAVDLVEACFEEVGKEPPPFLGFFCVATEGEPQLSLPAPVVSLATLPAPEFLAAP
jgi:adenine phosphoribosyltransferase